VPADLVFYLAFSTFLAHEMDAVHKREWRLLFVLRRISERTARRAFVFAHAPLGALLLWLAAHPDASVRLWATGGFDVFLVLHAGWHSRLAGRPENGFVTTPSWVLIYGAAVLGGLHLVVLWASRAPAAVSPL
jgi:hypothetical protein